MLRNASIRSTLYAVVGILVILLFISSISGVITAYSDSNEAKRMSIANDLVDHVLLAASQQALERGRSATLLSSVTRPSQESIDKIRETRVKGDEAFKKAVALCRELLAVDPSNEVLAHAMAENEEAFSRLDEIRKRVDANFNREADKDYPDKEFVQAMSAIISLSADMRGDALTSPARSTTLQEPLRMNAEFKNSVWLASEYAGRERALISSVIASGYPITSENRERLSTFRAINQLAIEKLASLGHDKGMDPRISKTLAEMESSFMGTFDNVRKSVYSEFETGLYPITSEQWLKSSTEGINSILAVSDALSMVVKEKIDDAKSRSTWKMIWAIVYLGVTVFLCIVAFVVISRKITMPLSYLNDVVGHIEQTGDLTAAIDVSTTDEAGTLAGSFGKMIRKFHDIIREMQGSADHLASASEEFSASASQIARGTEEQSNRADHVATASQEMNATIVEVAKNASGAASAAKNATETAMKGGDIVRKTIESMNGIAVTARESSDVISTLGGRSQEIGKIIKVIEDIADQTNLLALNAAIEAARAGEQGRGFAVVADEVRKLAERTAKATKEIGEMIKAIQGETDKAIATMDKEVLVVEEGVGLAREAGLALEEIVRQVETVTTVIEQIATASEEQSTAADQISGDIEGVAGITKETSSGAQQIVEASQEMASLASNLQRIVAMFKIAGGTPGREHRG
jgi:methyl-accepting chemotaxis protein